MTHPADRPDADAAACPVQTWLAADTLLEFPLHQRAVVQRDVDADTGAPALRLYHGEHEIEFDEPHLFAFGEALAAHGRFTAGQSLGWGESLQWDEIAGLLRTLVETGLLRRVEAAEARAGSDDASCAAATDASAYAADEGCPVGERPSPLSPAPAVEPRFWDADGALMAELTGRPLELGWLELAVPVFRVAHCALDGESRHVGESNVFPKALRTAVPTRWRTCIYPGTRYRVERPMNVTALKTMRVHWPRMMAALARIRAAFVARRPEVAQGWTIGHVEQLATMVLAVATHPLVRREAPVANGTLDPLLSSLFRVADGLRMAMHQMMFVPLGEPMRPHDATIDATGILDYAERNHSFHSEHGVCAGPRAMIGRFLAVLVDGEDPGEARDDPSVIAALGDLDGAFDYGLRGLRVHAALFSMWPAMARCYATLAGIAAGAEAGMPTTMRERLAAHLAHIEQASYLATEDWRTTREATYAGLFADCGTTLGLAAADGDLIARFDACQPPLDAPAQTLAVAQLRAAFAVHCGDAGAADAMAATVHGFLRRLQAVLSVACDEQRRLNDGLGRAQPHRAFDATDADLHNRLQAAGERRVPWLLDELEALLGLRVTLDRDTLRLDPVGSDTEPAIAPPAWSRPDSVGMVPAGCSSRTPHETPLRSHP